MLELDPLKRNNVSIVDAVGAGRGTLVFVHGFGTDQRAWDQVAVAFPAWRRVLLDNVGASLATRQYFRHNRYLNIERYAEDLVEVLARLQITGAVFVGHSVGAMISLLAALQQPEIASRLVLLGASPHYQDEPGYHGGFTRDDVADIYRAMTADYQDWASSFATAAAGDSNPHYGAEFAADLRSLPAELALTVLYSILQSDHRPILPEITQPTLLIQSREDHVVPLEVAHYLQSCIRCSSLEVIDASGHLPHVTAAPLVIGAMQRFLEG